MISHKNAKTYKILTVFVFIAIFALILFCNNKTHLYGDDFIYRNSFKDGSRIESLKDIFVSMYYHRISMNGRLIPHFFVQLFLMLPKSLFNIVNTALFSLMIYLLYRFSFFHAEARRHTPLLVCTIFGLIWVLPPSFASVFFWLDGSCNYLWSYIVILCWLLIMCKDFIVNTKMSLWQEILFILLCFVVGNYGENLSVSAVFMMILFIGLNKIYNKRTLKRWHIIGLAAMLLGFFFLVSAPGTFANKIGEPSFEKYLTNLKSLLKIFLRFWPLITFYLLSLFSSLRRHEDEQLCIMSLVLAGGALAAHFVLVFGNYISNNTTVLGMLLLMCACLLLLHSFFARRWRSVLCLAFAVLMCCTAYRGLEGIRDICTVNYRWEHNDQLLREAAANGEAKIKIPYIIPKTKYSVYYVWGYIREDNTHRFNKLLAEYHGLEEISGFWFYDLVE